MPVVMALIFLVAAAVLLIWSGRRAWRLKNGLLRWLGVGLSGLLSIVAFTLSALTVAGYYRLHARSAPVPTMKLIGTPAQIQRGEAIANSFCGDCHSPEGHHLSGGLDLATHMSIPLGSFVSSNLTAAGPLRRWSDGEIFRAIRNGIDAEGNWLMIMSYTNAGKLSDEDTRALIAYLRRQPAAGEPTRNPPDQLNLLGVMLLGARILPQGKPVVTGVVNAPPKAPTARYGEYVSGYLDCRECHGAALTGGVPGQLGPIGPDLNLVKTWKLEEFVSTMRTGTDPGGHQLREQMPWRAIGKMDDEELAALYEYLSHLGDSAPVAANSQPIRRSPRSNSPGPVSP
jgi:mono/diheme cytochrome c family protein